MKRESPQGYQDQFEFLGDVFDLIRKRGEALSLRSEALDSERMAQYRDRDLNSENSHLFQMYENLEQEVHLKEEEIRNRKRATTKQFSIDRLSRQCALTEDEFRVLLVLTYNEIMGKTFVPYATGHEILNLIYSNPVSAMQGAKILNPESGLFTFQLITVDEFNNANNFLRKTYVIAEGALDYILEKKDHEFVAASRRAKPEEVLYRVVEPRVEWDRVILNAELKSSLEDAMWQAKHGKGLMKSWGLDRLLEKGRGTVLLFAGDPGTGKTMAAEAMANRLDCRMHVADFSAIESKWIGDTEKNIAQLFREASQQDTVLLLDEADGLLASRVDGGQYNERAYNRQVNLLLTELENYEGTCILTTNRMPSLDGGLARRVTASFDFPIPEWEERRKIWEGLLPATVPLHSDVDIPFLAGAFPLAGGHIRNVVLGAARRAARRAGAMAIVTQEDLVTAARAERAAFHSTSEAIGFQHKEYTQP